MIIFYIVTGTLIHRRESITHTHTCVCIGTAQACVVEIGHVVSALPVYYIYFKWWYIRNNFFPKLSPELLFENKIHARMRAPHTQRAGHGVPLFESSKSELYNLIWHFRHIKAYKYSYVTAKKEAPVYYLKKGGKKCLTSAIIFFIYILYFLVS